MFSFFVVLLVVGLPQAQLWSLDQTYQESLRLSDETNAALEIHKHGGCTMDFSTIDAVLVSFLILYFICGYWHNPQTSLCYFLIWFPKNLHGLPIIFIGKI